MLEQTNLIQYYNSFTTRILTKYHYEYYNNMTATTTIEEEAPNNLSLLLQERTVLYCGKCGMPPEYCSFGPDFETHCAPWLKKHHPDLFQKYCLVVGAGGTTNEEQQAADTNNNNNNKPDRPWTTEERLIAFYEKYVPEKVDTVPGLLEKYEGKEDKLFLALTKKYGEEPKDPYY